MKQKTAFLITGLVVIFVAIIAIMAFARPAVQATVRENTQTTVSISSTSLSTSLSTGVETNDELTEYFDYDGGDLPVAVVTPIDFFIEKSIAINQPKFRFELVGERYQEYETTFNDSQYYLTDGGCRINKIIIQSDALSFYQELEFAETDTFYMPEADYGLDIADWNFDGYLDISLWRDVGGTSHNAPTYFWLWDNGSQKYIANPALADLSDENYISINLERQQIYAGRRENSDLYFDNYFQWDKGNLILVELQEMTFVGYDESFQEPDQVHFMIKERVNGEMQTTKDFSISYKEYLENDPSAQ